VFQDRSERFNDDAGPLYAASPANSRDICSGMRDKLKWTKPLRGGLRYPISTLPYYLDVTHPKLLRCVDPLRTKMLLGTPDPKVLKRCAYR
jgi:hypothetical protein